MLSLLSERFSQVYVAGFLQSSIWHDNIPAIQTLQSDVKFCAVKLLNYFFHFFEIFLYISWDGNFFVFDTFSSNFF